MRRIFIRFHTARFVVYEPVRNREGIICVAKYSRVISSHAYS